jgi:hypothetical protein
MTKEIHDVVSDSVSTERALDLALEALENNRRTHYYCEDTWYSCPKHEDGCANEAEGDECNCGADKANQEIDNAITAIKQARSAPVQEPVALDVTLDGEEAKLLRDMLGDDRDELSPVRLLVGNGHSGHGLYAAHAEYQEEGAVLLAATPPGGRQSEDCLTAAQEDIQRLSALVRAQQITIDKLEQGEPVTERNVT